MAQKGFGKIILRSLSIGVSFVLLFVGIYITIRILVYYIKPMGYPLWANPNCDYSYSFVVELLVISFGVYCIITSLFLWKKPKMGAYLIIGAGVLLFALYLASETLIRCEGI